MSNPAKYLVTIPPGAPIKDVGFVKPGEVFTAPSPDFVPSRTFRPVNEEAQAALTKVFDDQKARLEKEIAKARKDETKDALRGVLETLEVERERGLVIFGVPSDAPKIEKALSLKELGELTAPVKPADADAPAAPKAKGGRAADR